ncbi:MAG: hypothetical protein OXG64_03620 [Chloroflexi bacterium]|nr:hypothetical protein [Chloroflexota bacterium]
MGVADQPGSTEPKQFDLPAEATPGLFINRSKEADALEPESIGIITAVTVYIARVVRNEMVRWRSRARGTDSETRALQLLENIDRSLTTHHTEMTRYQASIADSLGQIKGRLAA